MCTKKTIKFLCACRDESGQQAYGHAAVHPDKRAYKEVGLIPCSAAGNVFGGCKQEPDEAVERKHLEDTLCPAHEAEKVQAELEGENEYGF